MLTTNEKGARTEGAVLAALLRSGFNILLPFGVSRYDLVIETPSGLFERVQCKTARLAQGGSAMEFNVSSTPPGGKSRNCAADVDYFGVHLPALDQVYLIPIAVVGDNKREVMFRLKPARNNQTARTRLAEQYRLVAQSDRAPVS